MKQPFLLFQQVPKHVVQLNSNSNIATTASMSISLVTTNSLNLFQTDSSCSSSNTPTNSSNTTNSSSPTTTSACTESSDTIVSKNQPKFGIPNQALTGRTLAFQNSWYDEFKWLHYSEEVKRVLCYTCLIAKKWYNFKF